MSKFPDFIVFDYLILNVSEISSVSYSDDKVLIVMKSGKPIVKTYLNSVRATEAIHGLWELIEKAHKVNTKGIWRWYF